jgi:signal transduction histidine kinase
LALGVAGLWLVAAPAQGQTAEPAVNTHSAQVKLDPKTVIGVWIWASETHDQQLCRFWRGFEIPRSSVVTNAQLCITVDNSYRLFLDGRELGRGGDWQDLTEFDLTPLLNPGAHTLAVEAFNDFLEAGVLAGLAIDLADGRRIEIASDQSWKVVPLAEKGWTSRTHPARDWPAAKVIAAFKAAPWSQMPTTIIKVRQFQPITLRFWQRGWFQAVWLSLCAIVAAICLRLMGKLAIQSQAQQVVRRERARIARDIHDDLSAGLTQLALMSEVARRTLPEDLESRQQVSKVCEKAHGLARSMDEVVWAINPQRDTMRDFVSYVCKYAETFLRSTPMRCRFDLEEQMPDFPCDLEMRRNVFFAVKEAIHNAVRHSGASELMLRIHRQKDGFVVTIEDNGKGFQPTLTDQGRNGLSNMRKRAREAGAVCDIVSEPGAGCRVVLTVPLVRPAEGPAHWLERLWDRARPTQSKPVASSSAASISKPPA